MGALSTAYSVFFLLMVVPIEIFLAVIIYNHIVKQSKNLIELEFFFLSNLRKSIIVSFLVGIPISSVIKYFSIMAHEMGFETYYIPIFLIFLLSITIVYLVFMRELKKVDATDNS